MSSAKKSPASSLVVQSPHTNKSPRQQFSQPQTTPTSIKRPRLMNEASSPLTKRVVKSVRFADTCNEIPPQVFPSPCAVEMSSDEFVRPDLESENQPAFETNRLSGGRFVQAPGFMKTSPRKNASTTNTNASPLPEQSTRTISQPLSQDSSDFNLRSSSPMILTPRRSAIKRKAQESLDYEHSAQMIHQSPSLRHRPSSVASSNGTIRMALSDNNIEDTQEEPLFVSLRKCSDGLTSLTFRLAEMTRTSLLAKTLRENGITTIGHFASLTPSALDQIPYLKRPKLENAVNYLKTYNPTSFDNPSPVPPQLDDEMEEQEDVEPITTPVIPKTAPIEVEIRDDLEVNDPMTTPVMHADTEVKQETFKSPSPEHGAPLVSGERVEQSNEANTQFTSAIELSQQSPLTITKHIKTNLSSKASTSKQLSPMVKKPQLVSIDQQTSLTKKPQLISTNQQTTPLKAVRKLEFNQQTTPTKTPIKMSVDSEQQTSPVKKKEPVTFDLNDDESVSDLTNSQVGVVLKKRVADLNRLVQDAFSKSTKKPNLSTLESLRELHSNFPSTLVTKEECAEMMTLLLDFAKLVNDRSSSLNSST